MIVRHCFAPLRHFYRVVERLYSFITGIMCSILPSSTNWTINYPSGTTAPYDYGTRATYQCNYGHRLASGDSEERTCTGDGSTPSGQWDGTAPQCPRRFCDL